MTHRQKFHHQDEKAVSSDQGLVFRREMKVAVLPREEEETSLKAAAVALLLNRHSTYMERFEPAPPSRPLLSFEYLCQLNQVTMRR